MPEAMRDLVVAILIANLGIALPVILLLLFLANRLERILHGIQEDTHRLASTVKTIDQDVEKLKFRTDGLLVAHRLGS